MKHSSLTLLLLLATSGVVLSQETPAAQIPQYRFSLTNPTPPEAKPTGFTPVQLPPRRALQASKPVQARVLIPVTSVPQVSVPLTRVPAVRPAPPSVKPVKVPNKPVQSAAAKSRQVQVSPVRITPLRIAPLRVAPLRINPVR